MQLIVQHQSNLYDLVCLYHWPTFWLPYYPLACGNQQLLFCCLKQLSNQQNLFPSFNSTCDPPDSLSVSSELSKPGQLGLAPVRRQVRIEFGLCFTAGSTSASLQDSFVRIVCSEKISALYCMIHVTCIDNARKPYLYQTSRGEIARQTAVPRLICLSSDDQGTKLMFP